MLERASTKRVLRCQVEMISISKLGWQLSPIDECSFLYFQCWINFNYEYVALFSLMGWNRWVCILALLLSALIKEKLVSSLWPDFIGIGYYSNTADCCGIRA